MLDKLVLLIASFGYQGAYWCALVLSFIGLGGTIGSVDALHHGRTWKVWVRWWAGTSAYYGLQLAFPRWGYDGRWWLPQLALDAATLSLLVGLVDRDRRTRPHHRSWLTAVLTVTIVARAIDIVAVALHYPYASAHQSLDVVVFLLWAWQAREDVKEALAIALYGLGQLPLPALMAWSGQGTQKVDAQLLQLTAQYAIAKPALLLALVSFLRRLPPGSPGIDGTSAD